MATCSAHLLDNQSEQLSTSGKDTLCGLLEGQESDGATLLSDETRVKVLKRSRFMQQQTVYDRENSTSTTTNRLYKVALVKVMSGENKGNVGWLVVSYRDSGANPVVLMKEVPPEK